MLFVLPPAIYGYEYPTNGDDTYHHLQQIERVEDEGIGAASRYPGLNYTWLLWRTARGVTGIGLDAFFVWFNWLAMAVVGLSIFWFGYKLWNWQAGCCCVILAMFSAKAMSYLFYNGTIYNIINMYVFVLQGILTFVLWLREGRRFYLIVSLLLFCIAGIYHSSTGMIMIAGMVVYLGVAIGYYSWKRQNNTVKKLMLYGMAFCVMVVAPAITLNQESALLSTKVGIISASGTANDPNNPVPFLTWMFWSCSPWVLPLIVLFVYILWQRKAIADINLKAVAVLCGFIAVMAVGAFTNMWYDHPRFALDLGIFVSLLCGGLAGKAIATRDNRVFTVAVVVVLLGSAAPTLYQYGHYSSTYTPADRACVEMLNRVEGSTWNCSSQIHPDMYGRFIECEYSSTAEYTIYRSKHMTAGSNPDSWWWRYNEYFDSESVRDDYNGMRIVGEWEWDGIVVTLYARE